MLARTLLAASVLLATPLPAVADVLTTTNKLVVDFTVDANLMNGPPDQLSFALGTVDVLAPVSSRNAALFDGAQLLGTAVETNFGNQAGLLSYNPANTFVALGASPNFGEPEFVDFSAIQDGSIQGRIEFTIATGALDFDPNAVYLTLVKLGTTSNTVVEPAPTLTSLTLVPRAPTGTAACSGDGSGPACPCGAVGAPDAGCPNSLYASGARLAGFGEPVVGADTMRLVVQAARWNVPGIFFSSATASGGTPFGDGLLCTAGQINRLGVVFTDGMGTALSAPELSAVEGLQPGDVRRYQYWYRDPFSACGGGFNTTNAFDVQW